MSVRYKNARLYWNMLKEVSGVKQSNISLPTFENYFKAINNPDNIFFTPDDDKI